MKSKPTTGRIPVVEREADSTDWGEHAEFAFDGPFGSESLPPVSTSGTLRTFVTIPLTGAAKSALAVSSYLRNSQWGKRVAPGNPAWSAEMR
jgi:hypothetical protein